MTKTSQYKGVSWDKTVRQFKASLVYKGTNYHCGYAKTEIEAVKLRDLLIIKKGFPKDKLQIIKPM